mgnify:CR=1 FL=1
MSVLRAGNTTLEDGKVRICVPIAYETEKEILEESMRIGKSSVADIAEWRIDWYQDVFQPRKRNALSRKIRENLQGKPLLVTFRSRREGGERDITPAAYQTLLDEVIESFFHLLDLVSKSLLASVFHFCNSTAKASDNLFRFLYGCCSLVIFDFCIHNKC